MIIPLHPLAKLILLSLVVVRPGFAQRPAIPIDSAKAATRPAAVVELRL